MHVKDRGSSMNRPQGGFVCFQNHHGDGPRALDTREIFWNSFSPRITTSLWGWRWDTLSSPSPEPVDTQPFSVIGPPDLRRFTVLLQVCVGLSYTRLLAPLTHMTRRKSTRPTAVLIGAMYFLGRCRALSAITGGAAVGSAAVRPTAAAATAGRRSGMLGFVSPAAITRQHSVRWARPCSLSLMSSSRPSSSSSLSSFARPRRATSRVGVRISAASPSRRRKRTALGMVSDRPFRGPEAEVVEAMDFSGLGLLGDLVNAMDEFGEEELVLCTLRVLCALYICRLQFWYGCVAPVCSLVYLSQFLFV